MNIDIDIFNETIQTIEDRIVNSANVIKELNGLRGILNLMNLPQLAHRFELCINQLDKNIRDIENKLDHFKDSI